MKSYLNFENRFRGSSEQASGELAQHLRWFSGKKRTADLGCGRGEFVKLLLSHGCSESYGVDSCEEMLMLCRRQNLPVVEEDLNAHLASLPGQSLDGIFMGHTAEHLTPKNLVLAVEEASRVLKKNGVFVSETLNPQSLFALGPYFMDPTHIFPVHPETLRFYLEENGFGNIEFAYRQYLPENFLTLKKAGIGGEPSDLRDAYNDTVLKLQVLLDCAFRNFIYTLKAEKL